MKSFDVVAFDADDTLWHSEDGFRAAEHRFYELLEPYASTGTSVRDALTAMERANLPIYGYGVKAFGLSMVEAALTIGQERVPTSVFAEIVDITRDLMLAPVRLLPDVSTVLDAVGSHFRVVMITKGDLIHQTRKVSTSGLQHLFTHVEIVLEKDVETYSRVVRELDVDPARFLMVGNSVKSDVLPVLGIGGHAVHVPYPHLWELERAEELPSGDRFTELGNLRDLPIWLEIRAH
ncbi:MAG: HAD family hydrolase [Actinomycetota bacterium]|nr:HAD family hydrolase [Actinomycetota bacterium]MDA2971878.1 HAD family hydrolase [Actinomycetota bacterium]MDA3001204.1 HAD family hydrolase [Actinomycetota bacterium]